MVLQQQINIAMQQVTAVLNAGSFKSVNYRETVKDFLASEQAFSFMNTIKELQLIGKGFKSEVLVSSLYYLVQILDGIRFLQY